MWRELWGLLKATAVEWWEDNVFRLAAALAFYTIFSIAPVLIIAIALVEYTFGSDRATQQIVNQIETLIGPEGGAAVEQVARGARQISGGPMAVAFSIVGLIVGATIVFSELQSALNHIWDVKSPPKRGFIWAIVRERMLSFATAIVVGFLLLVSLVISAVLAALQEYITEWMGGQAWIWRAANIGVSLALVAFLFALIYKFLPDARIRWRDVWIGAVVTAVLFTIGKFGIGLYLGQMAIGSTYGAAGSFVVLLVWVYYSALICFFGAEFTQVYARRYGQRIQPEAHAERRHEKSDAPPKID